MIILMLRKDDEYSFCTHHMFHISLDAGTKDCISIIRIEQLQVYGKYERKYNMAKKQMNKMKLTF